MEEDIIFGKMRHLYGGLEPSNMKAFRVYTTEGVMQLICKLPEDTHVDGQLLCSVAGAVIRRKSDGFPENEFDGELVADITENCTITDADYQFDSAVHYAAFPYTDQGVYNRSELNRSMYDPVSSPSYIFGYDLDLDESDPDERVVYPDDVDNSSYKNSARMNYTTGEFDYGDWSVVRNGLAFMPKPCMLTWDGAPDQLLDPDDYSKTTSGLDSKVADTSFDGNAMMQWPKIYTKRWEENGVYHFRCSDKKVDSSWECWCNKNDSGEIVDYFYTSIYPIRSSCNSRALSGGAPTVSRAYTLFEGDIDFYGKGKCKMETLVDRLLIQDLLVMISKTTDTQTAFGEGSTYVIDNGTMDDKGMFWGSNETSYGVKVFGMENWWGNVGRFVYGWKFEGYGDQCYKVDNSGYKTVSGTSLPASGYISEMHTFEFGRLPVTAEGSSTEFECDHADGVGSNVTETRYAHVGAKISSTGTNRPANGAFCVQFYNDYTGGNNKVGSAISYR